MERFVGVARPRVGFKGRDLEGGFGSLVEHMFPLEDLLDLVSETPSPQELPGVASDWLSEIVFTSGTTGVPKGVMLTHGNLLAAVQAFNAVFPLKRGYRALSLLPLSHVFEQVVNRLDAYTSGVRMTICCVLTR